MPVSVRFVDVSKKFVLHRERSRTLQEFLQERLSPSRRRQRTLEETFWALRDVSFQVEEGQTVGLVGPNGSGKSTALKLIARTLEPTSGSITINGRVSALLELGAGFHPDLTGRDNVYLNGSLMGLSRKRMGQVFDEIVAFSELEQFIDMPVKHYSSGMYTRLAFAVAIHVDPEILLVDEVLAVGDGAFQRKCMERITDLRREGVTILIVSHDLETVSRLCHQVVWLDKGEVYQIGDGREIINNYVAYINLQQQNRLQEEAQAPDPDPGEGEAPLDAQVEAPSSTGARITRIEVLDGDGRPVSSILTDDPMTVRIHYQADRRIEQPVFGLALHRDDDVHVAGPNTQVANYPIEAIEGSGWIDYVVQRSPLAAGRYLISASIYDDACAYCYAYVHQVYTFVVQPRTAWDQLGVIKLDGAWRWQPKSTRTAQPPTTPVLETQLP